MSGPFLGLLSCTSADRTDAALRPFAHGRAHQALRDHPEVKWTL